MSYFLKPKCHLFQFFVLYLLAVCAIPDAKAQLIRNKLDGLYRERAAKCYYIANKAYGKKQIKRALKFMKKVIKIDPGNLKYRCTSLMKQGCSTPKKIPSNPFTIPSDSKQKI